MKLTDAEWQIMNALWAEHPATARQIRENLPDQVDWAYTTIKTMLTRLVEKQLVRERKQGITSVYEPILTQTKARRSALRNLADQAFEGAFGPLMQFLVEQQRLSPKQRRELIRILEEEAKRGPE
jgi:BlaI family penicillinase repressor